MTERVRLLVLVVSSWLLAALSGWIYPLWGLTADAMPTLWCYPVVLLAAITMAWDARQTPRLDQRVAVAGLAVGGTIAFATGLMLSGMAPVASLWVAVCCTASVVGALAVYRRLRGHGGWAPLTGRNVIALLGAVLVSSTACGIVLGFPGQVQRGWHARIVVQWVIWHTKWIFVLGAPWLVLAFDRRPSLLGRWRALVAVVLVPLPALALRLAYAEPSLPLLWLVLVPSFFAGALLSPRVAAVTTVASWLLGMVLVDFPVTDSLTGLIDPLSILDFLFVFSAATTLYLALSRDERGRLLESLEAQRARASHQAHLTTTVLDSMRDGFVLLDGHGGIRMHNEAAVRLLGGAIDHRDEPSWAEHFGLTDTDGNPVSEHEIALVGNEPAVRVTLMAPRTDQRPERILEVFAIVVAPETADEERLTALFLHDASAEWNQVAELRRFAGTVAHDLRTPLTSIQGWSEVAEEELDDLGVEAPTLRDALSRVAHGSHAMEATVDGWLAHTVAAGGALSVITTSIADQLEDSSLTRALDLDLAVDAPDRVRADRVLLRQLMSNLIVNSVKYARPGERPQVSVVSRAEGDQVLVKVSDHGIGIPPGDSSWMFSDQNRADDHRVIGTGLGLPLCRRIVEQHRGRIWADRNTDGGLDVFFTLPGADLA